MNTPMTIMGRDSNCPMDKDPKMNPICASGSRNNSTIIRQRPYPVKKLQKMVPGGVGRRPITHSTVNNKTPSNPASYSCDGCRQAGPPVGNTMHQGTSVDRP